MGMLKPLLVTFCLLLPLTSSKSIDVHLCDKKSDYSVKVSGVEISPFPVPRAKPTTFAISSSTDRAIIKMEVSYFGFHVHSESHGLCNDIVCPIPVGDCVLSHSVVLPGITPPGSYTFRMRIEDENKRQLTTSPLVSCLRFKPLGICSAFYFPLLHIVYNKFKLDVANDESCPSPI